MSKTTFYWGLKIKSITNTALIKAGWDVGMYIVRCDPVSKNAAPTYDAVADMFDATFWSTEGLAEMAKNLLPAVCPEVETVIVKFTMTTSESEA